MGNEGSYVALGLKVWKAQIDRADKLFGSLSSEEVQHEIAPGRDRLLYLWGHLAAIHDAMLPLLGLGERLHPEFDVVFVSNPDKSQAATPSHEQVRQAYAHGSEVRSLPLIITCPFAEPLCSCSLLTGFPAEKKGSCPQPGGFGQENPHSRGAANHALRNWVATGVLGNPAIALCAVPLLIPVSALICAQERP